MLKKTASKLLAWACYKSYPNTHVDSQTVFPKKISPTLRVWLRPTFSDQARLAELKSSIYTQSNLLFKSVARSGPLLILDIGANIGLSTLSLLQSFPSVRYVVGIEADFYNYEMLCINYREFSKAFPSVSFVPIHAIATSEVVPMAVSKLEGGVSASGTFRFTPKDTNPACPVISGPEVRLPPQYLINDLLRELSENGKIGKIATASIACKIDIEGGEEYLLAKNTDWLHDVVYLTAEIHDRFSSDTVNSSTRLVQCIMAYDFAICPDVDVLMCYKRSALKEQQDVR